MHTLNADNGPENPGTKIEPCRVWQITRKHNGVESFWAVCFKIWCRKHDTGNVWHFFVLLPLETFDKTCTAMHQSTHKTITINNLRVRCCTCNIWSVIPVQRWRYKFSVDAHKQCHADCLHFQCATCDGGKGGEMFPCVTLPFQGHLCQCMRTWFKVHKLVGKSSL